VVVPSAGVEIPPADAAVQFAVPGCPAGFRAGVALPDDGALPDAGTTTGGVTTGVGEAEGGCTAALITGMPGSTPAFLTTTFAPNQAMLTATAVPAAQAATPAMTRIMSQ
jgi:hypothetical protein